MGRRCARHPAVPELGEVYIHEVPLYRRKMDNPFGLYFLANSIGSGTAEFRKEGLPWLK
jgi:hypothetical protein